MDGPRRLVELDGLRGVAATSVAAFHYLTVSNNVIAPHLPPASTQAFRELASYLSAGVQLFFLISGFVILMTLERTTSWRRFVALRALRLLPAFLISLGVTTGLVLTSGFRPFPFELGDFWGNLTMMPARFGARPADPSYWSLAYELSFYVASATLFYAAGVRRYEVPCLLWLCIAAAHASGMLPLPAAIADVLALPYACFFVDGVMIYLFVIGRGSWLAGATLGAALASAFLVERRGVACLAFLFAAAIWAAGKGLLPMLRWRWLLFLGAVSYPLYLVHQVVGYWVMSVTMHAGLPRSAAVGVAFASSLFLAWVIVRAAELPIQRIIRPLLGVKGTSVPT